MPIEVTLAGIVKEVIPVPRKALVPMDAKADGISLEPVTVKLVRLATLANASSPIEVTLAGIVNEVTPVPRKALMPIDAKADGISLESVTVKLVRLGMFANASSPIEVTVAGIVNKVSPVP